jgi:hypothetical protein
MYKEKFKVQSLEFRVLACSLKFKEKLKVM